MMSETLKLSGKMKVIDIKKECKYSITYIGRIDLGCDGIDVYYKVVNLEDEIDSLEVVQYLATSDYSFPCSLHSGLEYSGIRIAIDEYSKNIAIACIQFRSDNWGY